MNEKKIARLVIPGIDVELRQRYKIHCLTRNTTMKDDITAYIQRTMAKADKSK